jgi:hypothetical protein
MPAPQVVGTTCSNDEKPAFAGCRASAGVVAQAIVTRRAETRRLYRGAPFAQRQ